MQTWIWLAIALAVVIVALVLTARVLMPRRKSQQLHETFGPEYDRAVSQYHSQSRAEADLQTRQQRVHAMTIRPLTPDERTRFARDWGATQARFVDEPAAATAEADRLVADLMGTRGYPVRDFEQRAADISVNYPHVVENYRAAHASSLASERGDASTEDLRAAMIHYRALFDELLGSTPADRAQPGGAPADRTPADRTPADRTLAEG